MMRSLIVIVLMLSVMTGCGQKGPLYLPDEARRQPAEPPAHDVPAVRERRQ